MMENYTEAIDFINSALESDTHNVEAMCLGGACYVILGQNQENPIMI